jgi:hypothetical protein
MARQHQAIARRRAKDDALRGEGDRMLDEAVRRHPQFNNFTCGICAGEPSGDDPKFHTGAGADVAEHRDVQRVRTRVRLQVAT